MTTIHDRIRARMAATEKSARKASIDSGLNPDTIGKILKNPDQSQTIGTVEKLAIGLETTPEYLAFGLDRNTYPNGPNLLCVDRELLQKALMFVLDNEGVPARRAALIADILPEALSGPPVEVVDGDPFLSFRVHFQLEKRRSEHPVPR